MGRRSAALPADSSIVPPRVAVLTTGGTIASIADPRRASGYDAGQVSGEALIGSVPGVARLARLASEHVASIGSQDMNDAIWFHLAQRIMAIFARREADGVVVTHGTDTMEETAFFLDLVLPRGQPVVLTGSMRLSTASGADGPANLHQAIQVAAAPAAANRGVLVVLDDTIHGARGGQKMHTSSLGSFSSPNSGPLGHVDPTDVRFLSSPGERPTGARFQLSRAAPLPLVEIIYAHAQMGSGAIADAIRRGARGLVIAGVGAGNMSAIALAALRLASLEGIVVVRASRTGAGLVRRNIEIDDDALGFVAALDLNPQKARILTQLLIAGGITAPVAVQQAFAADDEPRARSRPAASH